jgi:hypothetical protein
MTFEVVEHLLRAGITAADLNDDCLGRTLNWLYTHDVTTLFAGLALRAPGVWAVAGAAACAATSALRLGPVGLVLALLDGCVPSRLSFPRGLRHGTLAHGGVPGQ